MKTKAQQTSINTYYQEIFGKTGKKQQEVIKIFKLYPGAEITNNELAHHLNWPINTVTPRVFELRKLGVLVEADRRKCSQSGRTAITWKLTK